MTTKLKRVALILTLLAFPVLSQAGSTQIFTDRDAFLSLPRGATDVETFNALDLQPGNSIPLGTGELAYTASCELGFYNAGEATPGDVWLSLNIRTDSITFTFTNENIYTVGGYFFTSDVDGKERPGTIFVTINDGTTYTATNTTPSTFVGFSSDVPITSLAVTVDSSISNRWPAVNDLIVAAVPPSFAIVGLANGVLTFENVVTNRIYSIEHRENLKGSGEWINILSNIRSAEAEISIPVVLNGSSGFFRVVAD